MFLRGQHDFKIQLPLYFLQPDWLIRSFPSNLKTISYTLNVREFKRAVSHFECEFFPWLGIIR